MGMRSNEQKARDRKAYGNDRPQKHYDEKWMDIIIDDINKTTSNVYQFPSGHDLFSCKNNSKYRTALLNHPTITDVRANACGITSFQAEQIFSDIPNLRHLNLSNNEIEYEGAQVLAQNTSLKSLDLTHNNIGRDGVLLFTDNTTLNWLSIRYNRASEEDYELAETAIRRNRTNSSDSYGPTTGFFRAEVKRDDLQSIKDWDQSFLGTVCTIS